METRTNSFWLLILLLASSTHFNSASYSLSPGQSLYENHTLVSEQGNFELGFCKPGSSHNYYIAIWYKKVSIQNKTVVWIANRENPLTDPSFSELKLLENGNLVILNQSIIPVWSTNSTSTTVNSSKLVLGDDGNLVLRDGSNPSVVFWQSFDHPSDTWLPGGKLRYDNRTKSATLLTSWKNSENPAQGMFSLKLDPNMNETIIVWNRSTSYWSSGAWDGHIFGLVPEMKLKSIYNYSYISNENESYFVYAPIDKSMITRSVMSSYGQIDYFTWMYDTQSWNLFWVRPLEQCDVYAFCGAFSACSQMGSPYCQCLPGFQPRSPRDWNLNDFSNGCVRKSSLQCGDKDGFWLVSNVKFPDKVLSNVESPENRTVGSDQECKSTCLNNCSCNAYYGYQGQCLMWNGDLLNILQVLDGVRDAQDGETKVRNLHLRLAASEVQRLGENTDKKGTGMVENADKKGNTMVIIIVTVFAGVPTFGALMYILWRLMAKQREKKKKDMESSLFGKSNDNRESSDPSQFGDNSELPFFNFEKLVIATNNFDSINRLGEGGFGPVYKGILSGGREIAVKRLSKNSRQGLEEFKNEVLVISKLQHRNLVRLLGCCIQGEEKMLIYEYMPNKSLDTFIFDPTRKVHLDWTKRFEIIMGVCRGIIYLHRDSRLRVIHRDLKASNILLDHELKPKISDFGMARIFGSDELQAKTLRVVGTYGYMSPEYAMDGVFSEKSDVYSFGVLLLELITGKKNINFYHHEQSQSLLGYSWELWMESKIQELIDPVISGSSFEEEIFRCIHVGLLCVQDFATDRPTMSSIVSMLSGEVPHLAIPKQPAFAGRHVTSDSDLSEENCKTFSKNSFSFTTMFGR